MADCVGRQADRKTGRLCWQEKPCPFVALLLPHCCTLLTHCLCPDVAQISMIITWPLGIQHVQEMVPWAHAGHEDVLRAGEQNVSGIRALLQASASPTSSCFFLHCFDIGRDAPYHRGLCSELRDATHASCSLLLAAA